MNTELLLALNFITHFVEAVIKWMHLLGFKAIKIKKKYYFDGHERLVLSFIKDCVVLPWPFSFLGLGRALLGPFARFCMF